MRTECDYCGKKITKGRGQVLRHKKHFCNKDCYFNYRREHPEEYYKQPKTHNSNAKNKIETFAAIKNKKFINKEIIKKLLKEEQ